MSSGVSLSRTGRRLVTLVSTHYLPVSPVRSLLEKMQASRLPRNGLGARFFNGVFIRIEEHRSDICCYPQIDAVTEVVMCTFGTSEYTYILLGWAGLPRSQAGRSGPSRRRLAGGPYIRRMDGSRGDRSLEFLDCLPMGRCVGISHGAHCASEGELPWEDRMTAERSPIRPHRASS